MNQPVVQAVVALIVDLLVGDPSFITHPVVLMGSLITWSEALLRYDNQTARSQKLNGIVLVLITTSVSYCVGKALIVVVTRFNTALGILLSIWLISTTIAAKGLWLEARAIYQLLETRDMMGARQAVGRIVGRDVSVLDEAGVIRATVESVAENTVDAVIAPLFFAMIGGAPLALAYRAVNTMDSMVGYKNQRYQNFGWAAARLDDVVNYIPARLTGLLVTLSAAIWGLDARNSWQVLRRDSKKHPSPNSGLPEAAVAGALQIQLGGESSYQGQVSFRPYLGNPHQGLAPNHIRQTMRLMMTSAIIAAVGAGAFSIFIWPLV